MTEITVNDLTAGKGTLSGDGVFDTLMRSVEAHIEQEYTRGRIKGTDYSTVYLGAVQSVLDRSIQFLLSQEQTDLQAQLLEEQVEGQRKQNALTEQQTINAEAEKLQIEAQTTQIDAQAALTEQQTTNAITEGKVLEARECKLRAEYDLTQEQKLKTVTETAVLEQKKITEKAQTSGTGVDPDSVLGRQIELYKQQAEGFIRDAEQKAAKLMVDAWNVQRTTDSGILPNAENELKDANIGRAVSKLLTGVNA